LNIDIQVQPIQISTLLEQGSARPPVVNLILIGWITGTANHAEMPYAMAHSKAPTFNFPLWESPQIDAMIDNASALIATDWDEFVNVFTDLNELMDESFCWIWYGDVETRAIASPKVHGFTGFWGERNYVVNAG
jgi:ABC-type transport system substrate-binding protein